MQETSKQLTCDQAVNKHVVETAFKGQQLATMIRQNMVPH